MKYKSFHISAMIGVITLQTHCHYKFTCTSNEVGFFPPSGNYLASSFKHQYTDQKIKNDQTCFFQ